MEKENTTKKTIEEIDGLGTRGKNALLNAGLISIEDVLSKTREELLTIDGFGKSALSELLLFLLAHKLKLKPKEKKKDLQLKLKQELIEKFLKSDRPINWPQEMRLMKDLLKKYPDEAFWRRYNLGFKLNSLFYFYTEDGKKKLANSYNAKLNAIKTEENPVELSKEKIGEDIVVKKPLSIKHFLNGI